MQRPKVRDIAMAAGHDDVIKWKHFPRYWPFVLGIHRLPVNSPHKGQWRGAWMVSLICTWMNNWVNNREAGDLRRHRAHFDVTVMCSGAAQYGMPETNFKLKSSEISFVHNIRFSCPIVMKLCTAHSIDTATLCAKSQNDWITETQVMTGRDFATFGCKCVSGIYALLHNP